jgi:hypothetical protein
MNRRFQQPFTMVPELYRGTAIQLEAMVEATSVDDLFARLEGDGFFLRIDRTTSPTMFRGAVVSESELGLLRQIEDVVRMGHVRRIERDEVILDGGRIPTSERAIHVHCAARGLANRPLRPIFEPGRVTVQPFFWGYSCYQFAMLGVIEATVGNDAEKNRLCPPIAYWDENEDYPSAFLAAMTSDRARVDHASLAAWTRSTRLNPTSGIASYRDDAGVIAIRDRVRKTAAAAGTNLQRMLADRRAG